MNESIKLKNLRKIFTPTIGRGFRRKRIEIVAVKDISLNIKTKESVAFIGPNGAGKSTTIKMLTGILHPTSGAAEVLGLTPWIDRSKLAHYIGTVFGQRSQLWYHLPPRDTFELLARIYNLNRHSYVMQRNLLIDRFGLKPFFDTPVRKLSLGQRMRAEVAASLLHEPKILFLDEPTIGLDIIARQELRNLICEWNQEKGTTVFLTSHDLGDIEYITNRIIIVNHGCIVLDDNVSAIRDKYLNSKILSVKFYASADTSAAKVALPGIDIIEATEYALKLNINTQITPIEKAISKILKAGSVADIAIEDPPLEKVISHFYKPDANKRISSNFNKIDVL